MGWRDHIKVHPAADLFPMASDEELKHLADDIRKNGMLNPITVITGDDGEWVLVDGRNRLAAVEQFSDERVLDDDGNVILNSKYIEVENLDVSYEGITDFDPYGFVISSNLHRRHLTAEQRRELIAKLLKVTPEKSNRQIGEIIKVDHKTVGTVRTKMESTGEIPQLDTTVGKDGKERKRDQPGGEAPTNAACTKVSLLLGAHRMSASANTPNAIRDVRAQVDGKHSAAVAGPVATPSFRPGKTTAVPSSARRFAGHDAATPPRPKVPLKLAVPQGLLAPVRLLSVVPGIPAWGRRGLRSNR
jgi:ParB-like nuclease domain